MLEDVFISMLYRSIAAGYVIMAVILFRLLFKRAPKSIRCILWLFVGIRLLVPLTIESGFSLIPGENPVTEAVTGKSTANIISNTSEVSEKELSLHNMEQLQRTQNQKIEINKKNNTTIPLHRNEKRRDILPVLMNTWLVGVGLLTVYGCFSYGYIKRKVRTAVPYEKNIYQSDAIASPFVMGIISPRIYLPFHVKKENLMYVITHEQMHISRGDHIGKIAGFLVLILYWYHPLVWIFYILLCRDMELACDEKVIRRLGEEAKKDYSRALLTCSVSSRNKIVYPVAFGEIGVKLRVKNILSYKKPTVWIILAAVLTCMVLAVCLMTKHTEQDTAGKKGLQEKSANTETNTDTQESDTRLQYYFGNAIESASFYDKTKESILQLKESDFSEAKETEFNGSGIIKIKDIEEIDTQIYGFSSQEISNVFLLKRGDSCEVFPAGWSTTTEGERRIKCWDYDGDGEVEIALAVLSEIGTAMRYEKLYIFDKQSDGHYQICMYDETCYEQDVFPEILSWYASQGADFVLDNMHDFGSFREYFYTAGGQYSMYLNETVLFELPQTGEIYASYSTNVDLWAGSEAEVSTHERVFKVQIFYAGNGKFSARVIDSRSFIEDSFVPTS